MTDRHANHKIMSLASSKPQAHNGPMTILSIPQTTPAATTPIRTLRNRVAIRVRNAQRQRYPMATLSEQALAGIRNVHSLQR